MKVIRKELPALILTLQQLCESSGDAEAFGIALLLASQVGIDGIVLLAEILDLLANLNTSYMQCKTANFTRLSGFVNSIIEELKSMKPGDAKWFSDAISLQATLEESHGITITTCAGVTRGTSTLSSIEDFRVKDAIPYLSALIENIERRFSGKTVQLLTASSIFSPLFPSKEELKGYGDDEIKVLSSFYGCIASVEFEGIKYTSPPVLNADELISEWKVYCRAMLQEKGTMLAAKGDSKSLPTMQELSARMMSCEAHSDIFPEMFKLIQIILCLPVGTATVERSLAK